MKLLIILVSLFFTLNAFTQSTEKFCNGRKDKNHAKSLIIDYQNLFSFINSVEIGGGGVCWWHSRFQINVLYLAHFNPSATKPTSQQARYIIREIKNDNGYDLEVLGSNLGNRTSIYSYNKGDSFLPYPFTEWEFTPYLEFTDEMENMERILANSCK